MWVTPSDVEARWISASPLPGPAVIQAWIGDAEDLVLYEFPNIQERIDSGDLPERRVVRVVVAVVIRVLMNPDNVRSRTQGTGPFSDGVTYAGDAPGGLALTDAERETLSGTQSGGKAFAVDTVSATGAIVHDDACSINFGATYCSCGAILTQGFALWPAQQ